MKVNKKIAFAVVYIVCALVGYLYFIDYSVKRYQEDVAIQEAEWIAAGHSPQWFEPDYFFGNSVYGRNVHLVGAVLVVAGSIGASVLLSVSDVLNKRRKKNSQVLTNICVVSSVTVSRKSEAFVLV